jgi:hypothetical protein
VVGTDSPADRRTDILVPFVKEALGKIARYERLEDPYWEVPGGGTPDW